MSTLNGQPIKDTYQGLIKTTDNAIIGATPKVLTDGLGNDSTLALGTAGTTITGNLDLTGATITGLPADTNTTYDLASAQNLTDVDVTLTGSDATVDTIKLVAGDNITLTEASGNITIDAAGGGGAAGLVTGGFANSMKNADALVTTAAAAKGEGDIVIGDGAKVYNTAATDDRPYGGPSIVIGDGANIEKITDYSFIPNYVGGMAIGKEANAKINDGYSPISIGNFAQAQSRSVSIGSGITIFNGPLSSNAGIAIGYDARATGSGNTIAIGYQTDATGYHSTAVGNQAQALGGGFNTSGSAFGSGATANAESAVALGNVAKVTNSASVGGIAIGTGTTVGAVVDAVAIGRNIAANRAGTVSIMELETQTVGGGIVMYSPNGTGYKLTVSDAGAAVFTAI